MEYQIIMNLSGNTPIQPSEFKSKKCNDINNDSQERTALVVN